MSRLDSPSPGTGYALEILADRGPRLLADAVWSPRALETEGKGVNPPGQSAMMGVKKTQGRGAGA